MDSDDYNHNGRYKKMESYAGWNIYKCHMVGQTDERGLVMAAALTRLQGILWGWRGLTWTSIKLGSLALLAVIGLGACTSFGPPKLMATPMVGKTLTPSMIAMATASNTLPPTQTETLTLTLSPTATLIPTWTDTPQPPTVTPNSALKAGSTQVSPKDQMVMVYVPEGDFLMGSSDSDIARVMAICDRCGVFTNEQPQHTVYLDAFWIDRTDVTNAQYALCVAAGKCTPPHDISSNAHHLYYGSDTYANFPVINIDWNQASAYCSWAGRSLPTEAEWEKAARGTDGRIYPWGNDISCDLANYCNHDVTQVGSYPSGASPYGAVDMAGNVWQWVADWYSDTYYQDSPRSNPMGPASGGYRVLRGGAWSEPELYLRAADRIRRSPADWDINYGFRCTATLTGAITPYPSTETPLPTQGVVTQISPKDHMEMVYIPEGDFLMGDESADYFNTNLMNLPQHTVYLDAFWIDRTDVTNGQYFLCLAARKCPSPHESQSMTHKDYFVNSLYINYPMINVDWNEANAYCTWAERRLPTESEWEKAARGTDGRTYPWGEGIDCSRANYLGNHCYLGDTSKVGSYPSGASPYGVLDMAGNVSQWIADWYSDTYYQISPRNNPQGPASGQVRVIRGGSWEEDEIRASTTFRQWYPYDRWSSYIGFRCASSA